MTARLSGIVPLARQMGQHRRHNGAVPVIGGGLGPCVRLFEQRLRAGEIALVARNFREIVERAVS